MGGSAARNFKAVCAKLACARRGFVCGWLFLFGFFFLVGGGAWLLMNDTLYHYHYRKRMIALYGRMISSMTFFLKPVALLWTADDRVRCWEA